MLRIVWMFVALGWTLTWPCSRMLIAAEDLAASTAKVSDTASQSDYQQVESEWKKSLAELGELQIKIQFGTLAQRREIAPKYVALLHETNHLAEKLTAVTEKAYTANDKDEKLGLLLMTAAVGDLRKDDYEDALRLATLLIDHNYPNKDVYRIAASAAFTLMKLDDAKKYIDAFNAGQPASDEGIAKTLALVNYYGPKWQREEKLRAEEAKADDLPRVKLHTTVGDIVLELFENEAPNTVANFISLVEKGLYDGVQFHRVIPNFMAQTGDPVTKEPDKVAQGLAGTGGPGYTIADECYQPNHREHFRGTLSMAHTDRPNSGGSQFFITFVPTANLDGLHTVFGRVIEGMDVLSKIQRIEADEKNPKDNFGITPDKILKAEVIRKRDHAYEPKAIPGK